MSNRPTVFTGVDIRPDPNALEGGNFSSFPNLTADEIADIPFENIEPGTVVFNTQYNVYQGFTNDRWNNFNTSNTSTGVGFEEGSPFAFPSGKSAVIQASPNNEVRGMTYVDEDTGIIYTYNLVSAQWDQLTTGGSGGSTFTDITVTNNATIHNLTVDGDIIFSNPLNTSTLIVEMPASFTEIKTQSLNVTEDAILNNLVVTNGITTQVLNVTGLTTLTDLLVLGDIDARGTTKVDSIQVGQPGAQGMMYGFSPILTQDSGITVTLGTAAGTAGSPYWLMKGSPMSGQFTLGTGTSLTGDTVATFTLPNTFWQAFSAIFGVSFLPATTMTAGDAQGAVITFFMDTTSTVSTPATIKMTSGGGTQLAESSGYLWNYLIIGNMRG